MKILFSSYTFAPNVGGIESVSAILAEKFAEAGHQVELITETEENPPSPDYGAAGAQRQTLNAQPPSPKQENAERRTSNTQYRIKYRVTRRPSLPAVLRLFSWCDVVFQ